nr:glycoside hydrolase family 88 protein [uncultured Acetatifactor sp.]
MDMNGHEEWTDAVIAKIREKMAWVSEKNREKIPYRTDGKGDYDDRSDMTKQWRMDDGLNWWTNGFWGGIMWLLYQDTGEQRYADIARVSERKMEQCFADFYGLHHDVGFMFVPTAVADFRLTGNPDSRRMALHAATLLAGRFNPVGNFIRAWNDLEEDTRGWAIIDCMFNLSLLYWASEETKDPRFRQIASLHADTVREHFVRPDGSVCHIVEFDPETGEMVKSHGGQGCGEGSAWTRGQGWALYGFMISYIHTGKQEYLDTAKRVADYCLANIPESGIIPVDFRQPTEPAYEDSCGACVIAGGLLELARRLPGESRGRYEEAAVKILRTIADSRADFGQGCDAIVQNCSAAYHSPEHHFTMSYADYYFIEAMYKVKGVGRLLW